MLLSADWMSNPFDRVVCGDFAGKRNGLPSLLEAYDDIISEFFCLISISYQ